MNTGGNLCTLAVSCCMAFFFFVYLLKVRAYSIDSISNSLIHFHLCLKLKLPQYKA